MKVDVYDTYATAPDGSTVHFDVLLPSGEPAEKAYRFALEWIEKIGLTGIQLQQSRCSFCHSENAIPPVIADIEQDGYHILPMEGCPDPV